MSGRRSRSGHLQPGGGLARAGERRTGPPSALRPVRPDDRRTDRLGIAVHRGDVLVEVLVGGEERERGPFGQLEGDGTLYFERRRMTCPTEVMPVIVSPLTSSWENVAVASERFRSSPCMAPVTGPERSGRAATVRLPVAFVPVWASVRVTGMEGPA